MVDGQIFDSLCSGLRPIFTLPRTARGSVDQIFLVERIAQIARKIDKEGKDLETHVTDETPDENEGLLIINMYRPKFPT